MRKIYANYTLFFTGLVFLTTMLASCGKDPKTPDTTVTPRSLATLGLYELISGTSRRAFVAISNVGTQKVNYYATFDTGSPGLTLDANGILPASMITSSGIQFTGDSVNVNGVTVTSQQSVITYGDNGGQTKEYGNLAYATITIGDANGSITTKRIPFFLYYKVVDVSTGTSLPVHSNDVFGVGPGVAYTNSKIGSPLSYFTMPTGVTSGFKLAVLSNAGFSTAGNYVEGLLTIGLLAGDLSSSSGFVMHQLTYFSIGGYSPDIPATIVYGGTSIPGTILFDTGTPQVSTIENAAAPSPSADLPAGTSVTITTANGFSYQYTTTATYNLTQVYRPSFSGDPRTIFSIDFFMSNEFLIDYTHHQIGLKNN